MNAPFSLDNAQRAAAVHGFVLRRPTQAVLDRLDLLAEVGGEATVYELAAHEGRDRPLNYHHRMHELIALGLVSRTGEGRQNDPYRYKLTPPGDMLRFVSL